MTSDSPATVYFVVIPGFICCKGVGEHFGAHLGLLSVILEGRGIGIMAMADTCAAIIKPIAPIINKVAAQKHFAEDRALESCAVEALNRRCSESSCAVIHIDLCSFYYSIRLAYVVASLVSLCIQS
jgi:hypothetical protein